MVVEQIIIKILNILYNNQNDSRIYCMEKKLNKRLIRQIKARNPPLSLHLKKEERFGRG